MQNEHQFATWTTTAEDIRVKLSDEYFKMEVGKKYSKQTITHLENKNKRHAEEFLQHFKTPQQLTIDCVNTIARAKTHKLLLKLHDLRKKKICVKNIMFNKHPVCWTNWRQFATRASDRQRKIVFDSFIKKTPAITPTIQHFFETNKKVFITHDLNPLTIYLQEHHISIDQLKSILQKLGTTVQETFHKQFQTYAQKFLGRPPQYYDDYYFMRNLIFEDLTEGFAHVKPEKTMLKFLHDLNFPANLIKVDAEDRPKKYPSPFCSFVKIPQDIRISYKPENPLQTAISLYHEFGHAAHAISITQTLPYHKKYILSDGLTETFSIFFENILSDKNYLVQVLALEPDFAETLIERIKFTEHYAIAFYVANSLLKIDQWEKNLSMEQMNETYEQYLKTWLGLNIPGAYWQLHHILPETLMYVPSYLLAMIQAHQLTELLKKKYGTWWWAHRKTGEELRTMMAPGADSPLADFSTLNIESYLQSL